MYTLLFSYELWSVFVLKKRDPDVDVFAPSGLIVRGIRSKKGDEEAVLSMALVRSRFCLALQSLLQQVL